MISHSSLRDKQRFLWFSHWPMTVSTADSEFLVVAPLAVGPTLVPHVLSVKQDLSIDQSEQWITGNSQWEFTWHAVHLKHQMWYCLSRATRAWPSLSRPLQPAHLSPDSGWPLPAMWTPLPFTLDLLTLGLGLAVLVTLARLPPGPPASSFSDWNEKLSAIVCVCYSPCHPWSQ